jgi:hypothetical protein
MRVRVLLPAVLLAAACPKASAGSDAAPHGRPARVSLAADQTPVRDQGARGTCTAFGAIAALEAAYRRKGYGALDLSEEFLAYYGKVMWIETQWSRAASHGTDVPENSVAASTGSTGTFLVEMLGNGFAVPEERDLPYRETYAGTLDGHETPDDAWWKVAWNVDAWNHDASHAPRGALLAPRFHRVADYRWIYLARAETDPTYADRFEEVLAGGHEIVWDVSVRAGEADGVWHHDPRRPPGVPHCMLIVGYDRSSRDPREHHFLVKNSWGPTSRPDGLTRVGYDFLRYGAAACWIADVAPPSPWPEARFVGRWHLSLDGRPAILAWNRVPGVLQRGLDETRAIHPDEPAMVDRRVGNLYLDAAVRPVLRVNGETSGGAARFWFDRAAPRLRYDERRDDVAEVRLAEEDPSVFVGRFRDDRGASRPCYGSLRGPLGTPRAAGASARDLAGRWDLFVDGAPGTLDLRAGGDAPASRAHFSLERLGFDRDEVVGTLAAGAEGLAIEDDLPAGGRFSLRLEALSTEDGVLVGEARVRGAEGAERVVAAWAVRPRP